MSPLPVQIIPVGLSNPLTWCRENRIVADALRVVSPLVMVTTARQGPSGSRLRGTKVSAPD